MNKKLKIIIGLLVCIFATFVFFKTKREIVRVAPQTNSNQRSVVNKEQIRLSEEDKVYFDLVTEDQELLRPANVSRSQWIKTVAEFETFSKRNGDAEFYGVVLDQEGVPLKGVRIETEVTNYASSFKRLTETGELLKTQISQITTSDTGQFSVREKSINTVMFSKFELEGYKIVGRSYYTFWFGDDVARPAHKGLPSKPVVFTLKKISD